MGLDIRRARVVVEVCLSTSRFLSELLDPPTVPGCEAVIGPSNEPEGTANTSPQIITTPRPRLTPRPPSPLDILHQVP